MYPWDKQHLGPGVPTWAPSTARLQPQPPPSPRTTLDGAEAGDQQQGGDTAVGVGAYLKWREIEGASGERWSTVG